MPTNNESSIGFSFILAHFRADTVVCWAILKAGVVLVITLTPAINA